MRTKLLLPAVLLASTIFPAGASAALGELSVVSRADGAAGALGDNTSYVDERSMSADGRFVVFISYADNLGGDPALDRNIFRRDNALGRTELVSRATGANGVSGDANSFGASISADGSRVAFVSAADNLSASDNNAYNNIFLRDFNTNTTSLVSRASGAAGDAANNTSLIPVISSNGNVVIFQSQATNLDPTVTDNNGTVDAFARDLTDNTTRLLSKSTGGTIGNGLSTVADLSADGSRVLIETEADNLGGITTAGMTNVYLRDRSNNTTVLVSQPNGNSNIATTDSAGPATINAAGDRVALIAQTPMAADHPAGTRQAYIRDIAAATTTLVSRSSSGAPADTDVETPVITPDGTALAFLSDADNLEGVSIDRQAFIRDLNTGVTQLISRAGRAGAPGDASTNHISTGYSNSQVVFANSSINLVPEATNGEIQVFQRDFRVVDPAPTPAAATIAAKRFTAKLSRRAFKVKVTTANATRIAARVTIRVSKKVARSGKVVVRRKTVTVPVNRTAHTLAFKLSKKQNKMILKALKTKRTRLRVTLSLTATGAGAAGSATVTGKLRR